jgi:glycosyltransferase involved in cell wall biosynthesis
MNILFIHQNFPSQFLHLAADLAKQKTNKVVALTIYKQAVPEGVLLRPYSMLRPSAAETHPLLQNQEAHILRAEACASAAMQLRNEGFIPDIIIAHPGWGEALFIKDVFPATKLLIYCEYYYALEGQDVGFDPEVPPFNFAQRCNLRLKNITNLLSMEIADAAISPTQWQKSTYPLWAQERITVMHEGIDISRLHYNAKALYTVTNARFPLGINFKPGDEVLTYVSRNLEPVRGFQVFMRTLPLVLQQRPNLHVIVVGGNDVSYGNRAPNGLNWKDHLLTEVGEQLDMDRVHFVGKVSNIDYLNILNISRVHTYWTTPFVLSWSFLEAAISGIPLIASATAPVLEFSERLGVETLPFFSHEEFANRLIEQLSEKHKPRVLLDIPELDLTHCLKLQKKLLTSIF